MVRVWTGRIGEGGLSEVNTTFKYAKTIDGGISKLLAPAEAIVKGHKHHAGDMRFRNWARVSDEEYTDRYLESLRENFAKNREVFRELLERDVITITCYCGKHNRFCHRYLLAEYVLARCATYFGLSYRYMGER
ncbi:MAG: hypothetical protein AAF846_26840 [Chloroflexota bacterium]